MNKYIYFLLLVVLVFPASLCFSQDVGTFRPASGSDSSISLEEFELQDVIKTTSEQLKTTFWFDFIYACQAVRENDSSYCQQANNPGECASGVGRVKRIRDIAEGNISSLRGKDGDILSAFDKRDASLLYKNSKAILEFDDLEDAEQDINIYHGFKHYSEAACNRFKPISQGGSYEGPMACKVLFGVKNPEAVIDSIALDLAYLQYAKEVKKNSDICERITDSVVRQACKGSEVKNLTDFLIPQ